MNKNYEMYKVYANVAYTWYQGNSNLKKATQIMIGVLFVSYLFILASVFNVFRGNDSFIIIFGGMFVLLTSIAVYFLNGMLHLVDVCKEMERQEDFWSKNGKSFSQKPHGMSNRHEMIFNAVQEVIKEKISAKEQEDVK